MDNQLHTSNDLPSEREPLVPTKNDADGRHNRYGRCGEVKLLSRPSNRTTISPYLHFLN